MSRYYHDTVNLMGATSENLKCHATSNLVQDLVQLFNFRCFGDLQSSGLLNPRRSIRGRNQESSHQGRRTSI